MGIVALVVAAAVVDDDVAGDVEAGEGICLDPTLEESLVSEKAKSSKEDWLECCELRRN